MSISPISSRKMVPPSAWAKRPARALEAPVNAPLACPNSSDSTRLAGIAAQFTGTNGPLRRPDPACSDRAASSLPVPDSPVMSTVQPVSATCARRPSAGSSAGSAPSSQGACRSRQLNASVSVSMGAGGFNSAATASSRVRVSKGLIRKSRAPACIARTASGISALPLIAITGVPAAWMRAAARISNPVTPGMRMSVRIRSKRCPRSCSRA